MRTPMLLCTARFKSRNSAVPSRIWKRGGGRRKKVKLNLSALPALCHCCQLDPLPTQAGMQLMFNRGAVGARGSSCREGTAGLGQISMAEQAEVRRSIHFHLASLLPGRVRWRCAWPQAAPGLDPQEPNSRDLGLKVEGWEDKELVSTERWGEIGNRCLRVMWAESP